MGEPSSFHFIFLSSRETQFPFAQNVLYQGSRLLFGFVFVGFFFFLSFLYSLISWRIDFCTILDSFSEVKTLSYISGNSCTIKILNILQSHFLMLFCDIEGIYNKTSHKNGSAVFW